MRLLYFLTLAGRLCAQNQTGPDVLIFMDGEKLIGELKSATDSKVVFKSDIGFEVTVPWSKIQGLRSQKKFAAIHKDLTLRDAEDVSKVPQGTLEMTEQKLELRATPEAPPQFIPVKEVSNVVDEKSFTRSLHRQSFFEGWKGSASFGLALTDSTTSQRSVTTGIDLSRADHPESWLQVRNRTSFNFNLVNGKTTQPATPETKISLFNADLVHDFYFKPRWFVFAGASFDHNYSQGLDLLQAYGGGIGTVLIKTDLTELDVRAGLGFMRQAYSNPTLNRNLLGSRFGENFSHTFAHGITLYQQAGVRPAWSDMKNFFGGFLVSLNVPVYRRMGMSLSSFDTYVNNPPPDFKKNSFQLTIGVNYGFK